MDETMVGEQTRYIAAYLLHDAAANVEGYITNYDAAELQGAEDAGMVILAEYSDKSRERVKASDVREPKPTANGIELVKAEDVDELMEAVIDVFDALAAELFSPVLSVSSVSATAVSGGPDTAGEASAARTFAAALAALKSIVYEGAAIR
ncbi:hypothetical protein [Eggerthella guodeyinii]|uniref:Uncharacterized protein n=1 Tax=Eggerthella guodeyinii TaxID=2690837 RepID=A0A6N7RMZ3_9ACTN|nr:hypothetical protein [Eggerthella guodeyinii]MRX82261.1 hypothetical protein [Eggerthella guodeyinii]